ncbi:MAG: 2TM domain-containing protein [Bacteroidota bacterium]
MTEREIYRKAQKRVKAKKGFYTHFAVFCASAIFLFTTNYLISPKFWWAFFPTLGWAIGIVAHYFSTFGLPTLQGEDWEERALQKEIIRLERKQSILPKIEGTDENITLPDEELELKEFKKLRKEWDDRDFV